MLNKEKLIRSFEEIVGWPYASPGSNDARGIDCSGAFVRAYRAQGASIYHGSNRIARVYCRGMFRLTNAGQLVPGMAIFKWRNDGGEPAEYKPGGRYYDPVLAGNFYHIGLVCGTNPLRIIHATTPVAKIDTALGTWNWAGWLTDVDYAQSPGEPTAPGDEQAPPYDALVDTGTSTRGLNFRTQPSEQAARVSAYPEIPKNALVTVLSHVNADWAQVRYEGVTGYVMRRYLRPYEVSEPEEGGGDGPAVTVGRGELERLQALLAEAQAMVAAMLGETG